MSDRLVSIGSYSTGVEAHFVRSQLEEAGIRAYVDGDATAGLGVFAGAVNGVRVLVAQSDARRALAVLTEVPDDMAASPAHEPSEAITDRPSPNVSFTDESPAESESPPLNAREEAAARALRGAVLGILLLPLQVYVFWLLLRVYLSDEPPRDDVRWRAWVALVINVPLVLAFGTLIRAMFAAPG